MQLNLGDGARLEDGEGLAGAFNALSHRFVRTFRETFDIPEAVAATSPAVAVAAAPTMESDGAPAPEPAPAPVRAGVLEDAPTPSGLKVASIPLQLDLEPREAPSQGSKEALSEGSQAAPAGAVRPKSLRRASTAISARNVASLPLLSARAIARGTKSFATGIAGTVASSLDAVSDFIDGEAIDEKKLDALSAAAVANVLDRKVEQFQRRHPEMSPFDAFVLESHRSRPVTSPVVQQSGQADTASCSMPSVQQTV